MNQSAPSDDFIDASIISTNPSFTSKPNDTDTDTDMDMDMDMDMDINDTTTSITRKRDRIRNFIKHIASLSLQDYKWRSELFKSNEADALMEKSLARMRGEDMAYVRPMDASDEEIGPLGVAEKRAVEWLSNVIEEEGKRAQRIAEGDGNFIRPMDNAEQSNTEGPLAQLERTTVEFFQSIIESETERAVQGRLRPMELEKSKRGPLGEAEERAVQALESLNQSEQLRLQQSRARGGDVVRPIDVPGPLGEMERTALEVVKAEQQRLKEKEDLGKFVRPKDASVEGPLGKAEREAVQALEKVKLEEEKRLKSIQRMLEENRPMENDRDSPAGVTEALVVGILRAPQLLLSVIDRVKELLQSENLMEDDNKPQLRDSTNAPQLKPKDDGDTAAPTI